jgi:hypothetical protein
VQSQFNGIKTQNLHNDATIEMKIKTTTKNIEKPPFFRYERMVVFAFERTNTRTEGFV